MSARTVREMHRGGDVRGANSVRNSNNVHCAQQSFEKEIVCSNIEQSGFAVSMAPRCLCVFIAREYRRSRGEWDEHQTWWRYESSSSGGMLLASLEERFGLTR